MFKKKRNKCLWKCLSNHKTWRIRNHPININNEHIVLSTDVNVGENGMILYDTQNDKFDIFKYPIKIHPEFHSYCKHKNDIYIFNPDGSIYIFNLNSKTFIRIKNINNKQNIGRYSSCINLNESDIIHIFGGVRNRYHLLYSISNNEYIVNTNFGVKLENPCVVYFKYKNKLLVFCGYATKSFFVGTIVGDNKIEWQVSKTLTIPNLRDFGYILFKNHIITFGGCNTNKKYSNRIYSINLRNAQISELKRIQCPTKDAYHAVLMNNKIHLFGLWHNIKHYVISIDIFDNLICNNDVNEQIEQKQNVDNINSNLYKQLEIKDEMISKLQEEIQDLKLRLAKYEPNELKLDEAKYEIWNAQMICLWISRIQNGILCKYKDKLFKHLSKEGIHGKDLKHLNKHKNWKRFGIDTFIDRQKLIVYVNDLVNTQSKKQAVVHVDELEDMYNNVEIEGLSDNIYTVNTTANKSYDGNTCI